MDEEDDIFASVNEFCDGNKLDEILKKVVVKNDLLDDVADDSEILFKVPKKTKNNHKNQPTSSLNSNTSEKISENNSEDNSNLNNTRSTRQRKKRECNNKNVTANSNTTSRRKSQRKSDVSSSSSSNNTIRTRQRKSKNSNNQTDNNCLAIPSTSTSTLNQTSSSVNRPNTIAEHIEELYGSVHELNRRADSARRVSRRRTRSTIVAQPPPPPPPPPSHELNRNARRNCIAEIVSRAQVVDCIDLVCSPVVVPQTKEPINLDSDDDDENEKNVNNLNDSIDETENTLYKIKVKWGKQITVFPYRKHQKFIDIIKHFAELENVAKENICLNLGDQIISENDTPDSINYRLHMFIYGRKVKDSIVSTANQNTKKLNSIEVKIQCKEFKKPILMSIDKSNTFVGLYEKCSEEFKIPISKIVLNFDGEILDAKAKPEDFDLEGNEIIDCYIKK